MNRDIRATVRTFVFGSLWSSIAFWSCVLLMSSAFWNLFNIWHIMYRDGRLTTSIGQLMLMMAFVLTLGPYVFFSTFLKLRKEAQAETDEEKRELICSWADLALRMFYFGAGGLALGFGFSVTLLYTIR
jgi:hypothetical protein